MPLGPWPIGYCAIVRRERGAGLRELLLSVGADVRAGDLVARAVQLPFMPPMCRRSSSRAGKPAVPCPAAHSAIEAGALAGAQRQRERRKNGAHIKPHCLLLRLDYAM